VLEADPVFGERARRLEARALLAGRGPSSGSREAVEVVFRDDALDPEARSILGATPSLRLRPRPAPEPGEAWAELRGDPGELERVAEGSPALSCLLAAHRHATAPLRPPRLMGIVNVTPDSFSDGGRFLDPSRAVEQGLKLVDEGADLLDVGGESTRPGSAGVEEAEELRRVIPVVEGLRARTTVPISIDTTKSGVARGALDAGADLVNDVSAGRFDPGMLELVAERGCELVLMHMLGRPRDMQESPSYRDVVREVLAHLRERGAACLNRGIPTSKIIVDPGIGFGKRLEDNLALIRGLPELRSLGRPILLGMSRKSFLGALSGTERPDERIGETAAAVALGAFLGAEILRVHDARSTSPVIRVAAALADERRAIPPQRRP